MRTCSWRRWTRFCGISDADAGAGAAPRRRSLYDRVKVWTGAAILIAILVAFLLQYLGYLPAPS